MRSFVKPPEPIPTAWADAELTEAHNHRKSMLDNCTTCSKLSEELATAILQAKNAEAKLTEVEALYNDSLDKLNKIVNN